jgi:protease IV
MNFIKTVLAVLVAQILIGVTVLVGFGFFTALLSTKQPVHVEDGSWLVVDVYGEIEPYDLPESIVGSILGEDGETLTRILGNLEKAATDPRIAGVVMKISSSNSLGHASLGEVRDAIHKVEESGKPVIAYSDALDRDALFLASACDSIFMPAVADVGLTGYGAVYEFYKGTLDKLAIHPNLHKIKEYKTFEEQFTRDSMSPEAKEMETWMINEMWSVELGAIARDRGISVDSLAACMDKALFTAEEAKTAGLIDDVRYWDEIEAQYGDEGELTTVTPEEYAEVTRAEAGLKGKRRIAVVHAFGNIGGRTSHVDPSIGVLMGHETVIEDLRAAAENTRVDAIIFRVDSPGGESLASELIAREVGKIAAKKPIIVSMGDVAASGGYAISYRATKIVADSLTITGSIGSIYGKLNTAGLWNKLGITFDSVTKGPNALMWSGITDFDAEQWKRVEAHHNASFDRWLADIAEARKIPVDELRPLTEGRVWTGRQAKERGLIDDVGGYQRAIAVAKEEAGIPAGEEVAFIHYPKRRGLYYMLTSGDAPLTLVRLAVYRYLHNDIAATVHSLQQGELRLWTGSYE